MSSLSAPTVQHVPSNAAWRRALLSACALACALIVHGAAAARKDVSIDHRGLSLLGTVHSGERETIGRSTVVLVHGTLAHKDMELIATLRSLLAERGIATLSITLSLGIPSRRGMYDCASPHQHRHHDAETEIDAWVEWLAAQGTTDVVLLGHSRGGNQVARYALANSSRLKGLVLLAPSTFDAERVRSRYHARHEVALSAPLARARALADEAWLDDVGFLYCKNARVTARSFRSYYEDDGLRDTPSLLPRLAVPSLVIAGSEDATVPDVAERSTAHVDDDTRVVTIDGADHFFRDLYAEDVADAIAAFVTERSP